MIVPIVFQEPTADDLSREEMYSMAEEMDQHLNTVSYDVVSYSVKFRRCDDIL